MKAKTKVNITQKNGAAMAGYAYEKVVFPTTAAAFAAHQERLAGRPLFENERKVTEIWVPIFNDAYKDGRSGDVGLLLDSLDRLDLYMERHGRGPAFDRVMTAVKHWVTVAWVQGLCMNIDKPLAWLACST